MEQCTETLAASKITEIIKNKRVAPQLEEQLRSKSKVSMFSPRQVADMLWGSTDLHDSSTTKKKYDEAADSFDAGSIALGWTAVYDSINKMLTTNNVGLKGNVLDAGCGSGLFTKYMKTDDMKLYGCDISEAMLDLARKTESYHDLRVTDLYDKQPYEDGHFDFILACGVLGYVESNKPLMEFRRLLKPGGILVYAFRQEHFELHKYQDVLDSSVCNLETKSVEFMDPFPNDPHFHRMYRVSLLKKVTRSGEAEDE